MLLDIDTIDFQRFYENCNICNKSGYGPCIKCENEHCKLIFHVECARLNNFYLEHHSSEDDNKYFIYCQQHRPLKLIKVLELRNQKKKEEIYKYFSILEKNLNSNSKARVKISQPNNIKNPDSSLKRQSIMLNNKRRNNSDNTKELSKSQSQRIISKFRDIIYKINNLTISVSHTDKSFKYSVSKSESRISLNHKQIFDINIFPWYLVRLPGITPLRAYRHIENICPDEQHLKNMIRLNASFIDKNYSSLSASIDEETDTKYYCYCRKRIKPNVFMVSCSSEESCPYNGWFHPDCVEELKSMTISELEDPNFLFTCIKCQMNENSIIDEATIIEQNNLLIDVKFHLDLQ